MLPLASRNEAVSGWLGWMMVPDRTDSGRDSRLPPNIDAGASALTEALVSTELRLLRFDEEANVKIEASSVKALFAMADWYVVGRLWGAKWAGTAVAGCGG